jgi:predicted transcriptional regulator
MEGRDLTNSQKLIMRCVWDYAGETDISYSELLKVLREDFGHDYKLVTLVTFLRQMAEKGYLVTYRRGKSAYVKPLVEKSAYIADVAEDVLDFWYGGNPVEILKSLAAKNRFSSEDAAAIREYIDNRG